MSIQLANAKPYKYVQYSHMQIATKQTHKKIHLLLHDIHANLLT